MSPTTLVLAYYDNPMMLQEQYRVLRALPPRLKDLLNVVIVDDGSPNAAAIPPSPDLGGIALQIYRMDQDIRWNQDACRNLGVHYAETDWVLLTDMDHIVPESTWDTLLLGSLDPKRAYKFRRVNAPSMEAYSQHPNTWFVAKRIYDLAGGYDERFAGYYGTDSDFRNHLVAVAGDIVNLKEHVVRYSRTVIADASTTTYLRKQAEDRAMIGHLKRERDVSGLPNMRLTFVHHRVFP